MIEVDSATLVMGSASFVQALNYGQQQLTNSDTAALDSEVLLCKVLDCRSAYLHSWPERQLNEQQYQQYKQLILARKQGKPVAYLTGERGFWSFDLKVTKATLIPRPDTELLVTQALQRLQPGMVIADSGTGSGAIALALAVERTALTVYASDYFSEALQVAQDNAKHLNANNVHFVQGDWLAAFADTVFDVIVANPPYLESDDPHLSSGDLCFEPLSALVSGVDGLDALRVIIVEAASCLKPGGWLLVEHGYRQSVAVQALFRQAGFGSIAAYQDFGGNDRVVEGQLPL